MMLLAFLAGLVLGVVAGAFGLIAVLMYNA